MPFLTIARSHAQCATHLCRSIHLPAILKFGYSAIYIRLPKLELQLHRTTGNKFVVPCCAQAFFRVPPHLAVNAMHHASAYQARWWQ